jgi:hypothetical protein
VSAGAREFHNLALALEAIAIREDSRHGALTVEQLRRCGDLARSLEWQWIALFFDDALHARGRAAD